jgi:hypothetical protein
MLMSHMVNVNDHQQMAVGDMIVMTAAVAVTMTGVVLLVVSEIDYHVSPRVHAFTAR